ncbi:MAG: Galanin, partial [Sulfurimonas sp.]|nr:Galanin [Sulfurimonas sp.]
MKTVSELTDFYYKSLHPILVELEEDRVALKKRVIFIESTLALIALIIFYFIVQTAQFSLDSLAFVAFGYFAIAGIVYKMLIKDYAKEFKFRVIAPLIK